LKTLARMVGDREYPVLMTSAERDLWKVVVDYAPVENVWDTEFLTQRIPRNIKWSRTQILLFSSMMKRLLNVYPQSRTRVSNELQRDQFFTMSYANTEVDEGKMVEDSEKEAKSDAPGHY